MKKLSVAFLIVASGCASFEAGPPPRRVAPRVVRSKLERGDPALLVCAYDAKDCRGSHLEGGITLEELKARLDSLPRDQEIFFVCG